MRSASVATVLHTSKSLGIVRVEYINTDVNWRITSGLPFSAMTTIGNHDCKNQVAIFRIKQVFEGRMERPSCIVQSGVGGQYLPVRGLDQTETVVFSLLEARRCDSRRRKPRIEREQTVVIRERYLADHFSGFHLVQLVDISACVVISNAGDFQNAVFTIRTDLSPQRLIYKLDRLFPEHTNKFIVT